jgi:hypothetical protein
MTIVAHGVQVVFDCRDPAGLAGFYAQVLHYKLQDPPEGFRTWEEALKAWGIPQGEWNSFSAIIDPAGKGPRIYFQQMDTPKLGKNRVHIDVNASGGSRVPIQGLKEQVDTEVERLLGLGATKQREVEEMGEYWVVMLDPEGNEFCVQ